MASNVPSTPTSQLSDKRINENENVLARKKRKHSRKTIDILLTIHLADRFYQKPASWIFGVVKTGGKMREEVRAQSASHYLSVR